MFIANSFILLIKLWTYSPDVRQTCPIDFRLIYTFSRLRAKLGTVLKFSGPAIILKDSVFYVSFIKTY